MHREIEAFSDEINEPVGELGFDPADLMPIIGKSIRVQGNNTGSAADLREAVGAIAAQRIVPVIDEVYDLESLRDGYTALTQGGAHLGKLAVDLVFDGGLRQAFNRR